MRGRDRLGSEVLFHVVPGSWLQKYFYEFRRTLPSLLNYGNNPKQFHSSSVSPKLARNMFLYYKERVEFGVELSARTFV